MTLVGLPQDRIEGLVAVTVVSGCIARYGKGSDVNLQTKRIFTFTFTDPISNQMGHRLRGLCGGFKSLYLRIKEILVKVL